MTYNAIPIYVVCAELVGFAEFSENLFLFHFLISFVICFCIKCHQICSVKMIIIMASLISICCQTGNQSLILNYRQTVFLYIIRVRYICLILITPTPNLQSLILSSSSNI